MSLPYASAAEWRDIPGLEGLYQVSDTGRVWSVRSGHEMKPQSDKSGHLRVMLSMRKRHFVHRLVLEAFVGPCPPGMQTCHYNDIPWDNRVENLRWGTRSANIRDCVRNGNQRNARKTHCPRGHRYSTEHTYITPRGERRCRTCDTDLARERNRHRYNTDPEWRARKLEGCRRYNARKKADQLAQAEQPCQLELFDRSVAS